VEGPNLIERRTSRADYERDLALRIDHRSVDVVVGSHCRIVWAFDGCRLLLGRTDNLEGRRS